MEKLNIFTTRQTQYLAEKVVAEINNLRQFDEELSNFDKTEIGNCVVEEFANGELTCQFKESVRDKRIYIFGQTGTHEIMELLMQPKEPVLVKLLLLFLLMVMLVKIKKKVFVDQWVLNLWLICYRFLELMV